MTIDFRSPAPGREPALRALFTQAFGDEVFTELFFRLGYGPERCICAVSGEEVLAAAHWFDCTLEGKKAAYLYGIAAFEHCRGRGIGTRLIEATVEALKRRGYGAIFLVPAEKSLFSYYERLGFRTVGTVKEQTVTAAAPLPLRRLTAAEYAQLRRRLLPAPSLIQEGPCLALLDGYAQFYATDRSIAAVSEDMVWEFLGDEAQAPGLIAALGLPSATVRSPGPGRDFAMAPEGTGECYLGLALD